MEVGLFAAGGEGNDAEGFVEGWVDHWAPPGCVEVWSAILRGYDLSETLMDLAPNVEKLPHSLSGERVAAVRRLINRDNRNPAGPKASRAQPP